MGEVGVRGRGGADDREVRGGSAAVEQSKRADRGGRSLQVSRARGLVIGGEVLTASGVDVKNYTC